MPALSVLMPARNAATTIGTAVRSTLAALPRDAELVVLDDGSTDGTAAVLERIGDRRLVVLRNDRSAGVAAGLNRLLDATDSRHVARMDADDVVLPGRFTAQRRAVDAGAAVVFAAVVRFGTRLRDLRPTAPMRLEGEALRLALLATNPFGHPTLYATRAALEAAGGYRECAAEDYDLWLRLAAEGVPLLRMRRPVLGYRVSPTQVSGSLPWMRRAMAEEAFLASYDALARRVLGATRQDGPRFHDALRARAAAVSGAQGAWLRRQIATSPLFPLLPDLAPVR